MLPLSWKTISTIWVGRKCSVFCHNAKILVQFWELLLCLSQKTPGWPEVQCWQLWEGAWLWLSEHPTSAVKTAATHSPQGKAEQMVLPSLPPATLKDRHIFCSTCVAQGQNLQRWLPAKMSLSQALERSTEDTEISFKAFLSFSSLRQEVQSCWSWGSPGRTLLKVDPLKFSVS